MQNLQNLVRLDIGNNNFTDLVSERKYGITTVKSVS